MRGFFLKNSRKRTVQKRSYVQGGGRSIDKIGICLPPVDPITAKTGWEPAIIECAKVLSDRRQHRPIPDFPYTLDIQIANALNAIVINATGRSSAVPEHRQG